MPFGGTAAVPPTAAGRRIRQETESDGDQEDADAGRRSVSADAGTSPGQVVHDVAARVSREERAYAAGTPRPLGGYATLLSGYSAGVVALAWALRRRGRLPERIPAADLALLAVATHKLSRVVTKDSVMAVVRAPFTRFDEPIGEGEVNEEVRGTGVRHAAGELLTCPFCFGQWIATAFVGAYAFAPRATRLVASVFAILAGSDALQFAYTGLRNLES
jgi:hypothetical protein